jgi:hypothetical protein
MEAGAAPSANTLVVARPIWLRLALLVGVSALARFVVALATPVPWIFPDEWIYAELARSFADSRSFSVWDVQWPVRGTGPLYPVLLSPIYALSGSLEHAYVTVKALNALLMSLAAVPAFLLGRRLLSEGMAFFAAALAVLVPAMVYTSKVMTENVAYPIFLLAALAVVRVLERPTLGRQATVWALLVLASLARAEMFVLVLVYVSALVLLAYLDARAERNSSAVAVSRRLATYRATWFAALGGLTVLAVGLALAGRGPTSLFGAYHSLPGQLDVAAVPRWLLYALAELDLATGVLPFAAFLLVSALVLRGSLVERPLRVFVAVALPTFVWFTVLGGSYATQPRPEPPIFERYVFYVMPLLLIALVYWLERGLPRPRPWAALAAGISLLLPATLPFGTLLNDNEWGVNSSTPGLVPWASLGKVIGTGWTITGAVLAVCTGLAVLFMCARRERESLVRFVAVCMLWVAALTLVVVDVSAGTVAKKRVGDQRAWVDEAVGDEPVVAVVWPGWATSNERAFYALVETQFFNRSVRRIYHAAAPVAPGAPSQALPASLPNDVEYVVATRTPSPSLVVARQPGGTLVLLRIPPDGE